MKLIYDDGQGKKEVNSGLSITVEVKGIPEGVFYIEEGDNEKIKNVGNIYFFEDVTRVRFKIIRMTEKSFKIMNVGLLKTENKDSIEITSNEKIYIEYALENGDENTAEFDFWVHFNLEDIFLVDTFRVDSYYRPFYFNAVVLLEEAWLPNGNYYTPIGVKTIKYNDGTEYKELIPYSATTDNNKDIIPEPDKENYWNTNYVTFYCAIANGCTIRKKIEGKDCYCIGDITLNISQGMERNNYVFSDTYREISEIKKYDEKNEKNGEINITPYQYSVSNWTIGRKYLQKIKDGGTFGKIYFRGLTNFSYKNGEESITYNGNLKKFTEIVYDKTTEKDIEDLTVNTFNPNGISVRLSVKEGSPVGMEDSAQEIEAYYNGVKFYDYIGRKFTIKEDGSTEGLTNTIIAYGYSSSKCRYYWASERDYNPIIKGGIFGDNSVDRSADKTFGVTTQEKYYWKEGKTAYNWNSMLTRDGGTTEGDAYLYDNEITQALKGDGVNQSTANYVIGICDIYTELDDDAIKLEKSQPWSQIKKHTSRLSIVKIYRLRL